MPATLTGSLLTSYRATAKYDRVFQLSTGSAVPAGYTALNLFLIENYLLVLSKNGTALRLTITDINTQTVTRTINMDGLTNPTPLVSGSTLYILSSPSYLSKLTLSGGVWGDLVTEGLSFTLPTTYSFAPTILGSRIWLENGTSGLRYIDVTSLATDKFTTGRENLGRITSLQGDPSGYLYLTRLDRAYLEIYTSSGSAPFLTYNKEVSIKPAVKPAYLNTINQITPVTGEVLLGGYDGTLKKYNLSSQAISNLSYTMTDLKFLTALGAYATLVSMDGEVRLYDLKEGEELPVDTFDLNRTTFLKPTLTEQFLVLGDSSGRIIFYKLDDLPTLKLNYVYIEAKNPTTKYLDLNVELTNPVANVVSKTPYEVTIQYRGASAVKTLAETGLKRNFYLPLSMYSTILSEASLYLGSQPITYRLLNLSTGLVMTDGTATLYSGKLEKIFLKDFYQSEDDIYFKLQYLSTAKSSLVFTINGKKVLYTTETENWYNPSDYLAIYTRTDFPDLATKFYLLKGTNVGKLSGKTVSVKIELLVGGVVKETLTQTKDFITKLAYADLQYSTSAGDIRYQDELLLTELEQGSKTTFLEDNSLTPALVTISKMDISLTDSEKIGNIISGEGDSGYLSFPIRSDYANHLYQSDSLLMDIYINGYKLPRSNSQQQYTMEGGALRVDYPVRDLQNLLNSSQLAILFDKSISDSASNITILATVRRKPLVNSEILLGSYTVNSDYQNDITLLQGGGILLPFTTTRSNLSQAELRLFIRNSSSGLIRRFNPSNYTLTLDLANKQILVELLGTTNLDIGSELIIVDSGYLTNTIKYVNNNTSYRMDSLPLVSFDSENNMYSGLVANPEDLDVTVNGLTLIPGRDYSVLEPALDNTPAMITFRNYLPVGATVEVNYLPEGAQTVHYWATPAKGTSTYFSLDDERSIFVDGTFETFVNNLKVDESKVTVRNNRTISVNVSNPRHVMVRFSNRQHSNLKLIQDSYKFATIDINDNNYHSKFSLNSSSMYDDTSLGLSTDIGKITLLEILNSSTATTFDCNQTGSTLTDVYLDSKYIENQYINKDIIVDANRTHKPLSEQPTVTNPSI